jgi:hypothetical protein
VRFEYLSLADAANSGPEGKLNVLGLGSRIINLPGLPGGTPLAIVGSVSAAVDEAGSYELVVFMVEPDGTEVQLVQGSAIVPSDVEETRVPTGSGFLIGFAGPFRLEGVHRIHARFGTVESDYEFVVRVRGADSIEAA